MSVHCIRRPPTRSQARSGIRVFTDSSDGQQSFQRQEVFAWWATFAGFPPAQRPWINTQTFGKLFSGEPERFPVPDDLLGESPGRRKGVVAEERDELRDAMNPRLCGPRFPVVDGRFVHAELLRNLLLEEAKIKSALTEMTTNM